MIVWTEKFRLKLCTRRTKKNNTNKNKEKKYYVSESFEATLKHPTEN